MHHVKKKTSKIFSPEGPCENVSPGPAVALDGPADMGCVSLRIAPTPELGSPGVRFVRLDQILVSVSEPDVER